MSTLRIHRGAQGLTRARPGTVRRHRQDPAEAAELRALEGKGRSMSFKVDTFQFGMYTAIVKTHQQDAIARAQDGVATALQGRSAVVGSVGTAAPRSPDHDPNGVTVVP
jgi:hypothetical protein